MYLTTPIPHFFFTSKSVTFSARVHSLYAQFWFDFGDTSTSVGLVGLGVLQKSVTRCHQNMLR